MLIYRLFNDADSEAESLYYEDQDDADEACEEMRDATECDDWRVEAVYVRDGK